MTNKVGLTLNDQDMTAIGRLTKVLDFSSRAQAVRFALALADFLVSQLAKGDTELVLRRRNGSLERVHMAEFNRLRAYEDAALHEPAA